VTNRQSKASLVIRHHIVTPAEPDDLFRLLRQICAYHLDVLPLSSGKSGAVSGEVCLFRVFGNLLASELLSQVALHAGPSVAKPKIKVVPRSQAIQYRLTDTGVVFFERGTGGGFL
jgi:hypothetical protein